MPINLQVKEVFSSGDSFEVVYTAYFTGTYTLNGTGDPIDWTASLNPDGSSRNANFKPGCNAPAREPIKVEENGGDMGGAYVGLQFNGKGTQGAKARFYQANGTELGTGAAYPAGTPGSAAASQLVITATYQQGTA